MSANKKSVPLCWWSLYLCECAVGRAQDGGSFLWPHARGAFRL
uniref:LD38553p n=1 Tax=Drosophila melanogaster TaxID=7227 RepID=Q95SZ1_DROME|nr:LD38553p [Drosophila melanogaster]